MSFVLRTLGSPAGMLNATTRAYDRQKYKRGGEAFFGGAPSLTIDVLKNFADFYVSGANGTTTTNPNFGRPYVTVADRPEAAPI